MKKASVTLFVLGIICVVMGVFAKFFTGIIFQIKPISYVIMGNTSVLVALYLKSNEKK